MDNGRIEDGKGGDFNNAAKKEGAANFVYIYPFSDRASIGSFNGLGIALPFCCFLL